MLTFCTRWIVLPILALGLVGTPTADGGRSPRRETAVVSGAVAGPMVAVPSVSEAGPVHPELWLPAWLEAQRTCNHSWAQVADLLRN